MVPQSRRTGNAGAQFNLALCYRNGRGLEKNDTEAVQWYHKAAEQGYAEAQYNLGYCYLMGYGVKKNHPEAIKWFRKAAEQEFEPAQKILKKLGY